MYSPLEQFELTIISKLSFILDYSLTNSVLIMFLLAATLGFFYLIGSGSGFRLVPSAWQSFVEELYLFFR